MIQEWTCGKEVMLIMQYKQLYITHRAVGCIAIWQATEQFSAVPSYLQIQTMATINHVTCEWFVALLGESDIEQLYWSCMFLVHLMKQYGQ